MREALATQPIYSDAILEGNTPEVLNSIWNSECAVAVYHRNPESKFQDWLDQLPPENLPKVRLATRPEQVQGHVLALCDKHGIADGTYCQELASDISLLAGTFARVMDVSSIILRLDVVNNNACRRFHQDNVAARLLCTYRGQGTEYGSGLSGDIPENIEKLPTGSAAIFRGRRWQDVEPSSIVHRSPPIEGSGETRLLLVIDTPTDDD
ncbi:MAG: DUF1826 domain-containing protein [Kordiimonas sp.]